MAGIKQVEGRSGLQDSQLIGAAAVTARTNRPPLRLGLVNNMPDAAYDNTERQFGELIRLAVGARPVSLQRFFLRGVSRSPAGHARVRAHARSVDEIAGAGLDALIVTGAEPRADNLRDEPFWPEFARLVDWADRTGTPTLWSCLAAHAAALHLDGAPRRRLAQKVSGVFAVTLAPDLSAVAGYAPHSRSNTVDETDLVERGYRVLTRSPLIGVDGFARAASPRFLFCQGHLEYDADTLSLEFRRDMLRFLRGERTPPPRLPENYYAPQTENTLADLRQAALSQRSVAVMTQWPRSLALRHPQPVWRDIAATLYRRWLTPIA